MRRSPESGGRLSEAGAFIARRRRSRIFRKTADFCRRYLEVWSNLDYDIHRNGELRVLEVFSSLEPLVVFDVGANVGDWSMLACQTLPGATIYAFEISPPTFESLIERCAGSDRVVCEGIGLSDREETIVLRHYPDMSCLTSSSAYPHQLPYLELTGRTEMGDSYASAHGIERIDFLKIDAEGMEDRILHGFAGMFGRKAIDVVQFEYGRVNILTRFLLRDFHEFFARHGYRVGKVFPSYVDFREYQLTDEDFLGPNYVACRADREDYLRALQST